MRLYSYYRSSCSYRVRIGLALKGVAYEYVPVNIAPGVKAQSTEAYGGINPMRQVPVLEWTDHGQQLQLTQSVAILEYLEERWPAPALLPKDALARARVRQAVEVVNSGIQPLQNSKLLEKLRDSAGVGVEEHWRDAVIRQGLFTLERLALAQDGPFFLGRTPCLADLFILPQLYNARRFDVSLASFPRLLALESHALTQEAFQRAHPDRQPDAPPT
jgi:maleylpyruvate isomerase